MQARCTAPREEPPVPLPAGAFGARLLEVTSVSLKVDVEGAEHVIPLASITNVGTIVTVNTRVVYESGDSALAISKVVGQEVTIKRKNGPPLVGRLKGATALSLTVATPDEQIVALHDVQTVSGGEAEERRELATVYEPGWNLRALHSTVGKDVQITRPLSASPRPARAPTPAKGARDSAAEVPKAKVRPAPIGVDVEHMFQMNVSYSGVFAEGADARQGGALSAGYRLLDPQGRFPTSPEVALAFDFRIGVSFHAEHIPAYDEVDGFGNDEKAGDAMALGIGPYAGIFLTPLVFTRREASRVSGVAFSVGLSAVYLFALTDEGEAGFRPAPQVGIEFPSYDVVRRQYSSWNIVGAVLPGDITAVLISVGFSR